MGRSGYNTEAVVEWARRSPTKRGSNGSPWRDSPSALASAPSLYAHVDGLDDLRRRIGEHGARELGRRARFRRRRTVRRRGACRDRRCLSSFAREHPGQYAAVERAPSIGADPEAARAPVDAVLAALRGYGLEGDDADPRGAHRPVRSARVRLAGGRAAGSRSSSISTRRSPGSWSPCTVASLRKLGCDGEHLREGRARRRRGRRRRRGAARDPR